MAMSVSDYGEGAFVGSAPQAAERACAAFEAISTTARAAWKVSPGWEDRLRPALSRLLMLGQARDAFEQRLGNLLDALSAAKGRGAVGARPFHTVVAMQLDALAALLERTAEDAGGGIEALAATGAATNAGPDCAMPDDTRDPVADLYAAADILRSDAQTHRAWPCAEGITCDLDWMAALYKTDDERRVHRSALARADTTSA